MPAVLEYHMNYFSLFKAVDYHATVDVATSFLMKFYFEAVREWNETRAKFS